MAFDAQAAALPSLLIHQSSDGPLSFVCYGSTQGTAAFTSAHTIEVGGQSLDFAAAVIATGGRASIPSIPGLDGVDYMTNDSFYNQTELPGRLAVIGAGPIGEPIKWHIWIHY